MPESLAVAPNLRAKRRGR